MQPIRKKIHAIAEDDSFLNDSTLKQDNFILLISIAFLALFLPLFDNEFFRDWSFDITISAIIVSGITSLKFKKEKFIRISYFGMATFIIVWVHHFVDHEITKLLSFAVLITFFIYITFSMIVHVAESETINSIMILNAINSYLLIGLVGAFLFISVEVGYSYFANSEHALVFNTTNNPIFQDYVYFSFVTLTTLGYGDITPIIPIAKSLTIALSLTGQLYLTILVAMLVGKFASQTKN